MGATCDANLTRALQVYCSPTALAHDTLNVKGNIQFPAHPNGSFAQSYTIVLIANNSRDACSGNGGGRPQLPRHHQDPVPNPEAPSPAHD